MWFNCVTRRGGESFLVSTSLVCFFGLIGNSDLERDVGKSSDRMLTSSAALDLECRLSSAGDLLS